MKAPRLNYLSVFLCSLFIISSCSDDSATTTDDDPDVEVDGEDGGTDTGSTNGVDTTIEITTADYSAAIDENSASNSSLGRVSASTNTGTLVFAIDSQEPDGAVAIDAETGELSIANASIFNYEINSTITGVVSATVESTSQNLNFTISINDVTETSTLSSVSTFAGSSQGYVDGDISVATFYGPSGLALDTDGNLYVTEYNNHTIRKITPDGLVSTLAGGTSGFSNGDSSEAKFFRPRGIIMGNDGYLYVADCGNNRIRKVSLTGDVTTVAGNSSQSYEEGTGTSASFDNPSGLAMIADGTIYVTDTGNQSIRKITADGVVSTLAGGTGGSADGTGTDAQFNSPYGIVLNSDNELLVTDLFGRIVRNITFDGVVTTWAGSGSSGSTDSTRLESDFGTPTGLAVDQQGDVLVSDTRHNNIRKIYFSVDEVDTLAGLSGSTSSNDGDTDGVLTQARFSNPEGMVIAPDGSVYIADYDNHRIRIIE